MYIRWIVRGHKNEQIVNVTFHDAYLVESFRDETGQPRQRMISYLGNIRQMDDTFPTIERELFLLRAQLILQNLPELSDEDRADVLRQLEQKVPPLTKQEVREAFRANLHWYFKWWSENGDMPSSQEMQRMIMDASRDDDVPPV